MENINELLGHSKIQSTSEYYGKIVEKKISLEMERLKGK